jgi:flagellar hook assembly protein FlgD
MVKITDLAGNLVSEMESTGGQAIWNGKHQSGASVASGVYLVLASTPMGTKKQVTKILIIR